MASFRYIAEIAVFASFVGHVVAALGSDKAKTGGGVGYRPARRRLRRNTSRQWCIGLDSAATGSSSCSMARNITGLGHFHCAKIRKKRGTSMLGAALG